MLGYEACTMGCGCIQSNVKSMIGDENNLECSDDGQLSTEGKFGMPIATVTVEKE